jgi:hypothetical protein
VDQVVEVNERLLARERALRAEDVGARDDKILALQAEARTLKEQIKELHQAPPPPPPLVLSGHAASLTPY